MKDLEQRVSRAVQHFWTVRAKQATAQGGASGRRDAGNRAAVTGGKHLDGFVQLLCDILAQGGTPASCVYFKRHREIPGFFRATKQWDLLLVADDKLIAAVECKAIVGSFGNNMNNRSEESVGNALDLQAAYREGAFRDSLRPWLGYLLIIEDRTGTRGSRNPIRMRSKHFPVLPEFENTSYIDRGQILLRKLVRESLYDAACLITSESERGATQGAYGEPSSELSFKNFTESLLARAMAHARTHGRPS